MEEPERNYTLKSTLKERLAQEILEDLQSYLVPENRPDALPKSQGKRARVAAQDATNHPTACACGSLRNPKRTI